MVVTIDRMDAFIISEIFNRLMDGGILNRSLALDDRGICYESLIDKYGYVGNSIPSEFVELIAF